MKLENVSIGKYNAKVKSIEYTNERVGYYYVFFSIEVNNKLEVVRGNLTNISIKIIKNKIYKYNEEYTKSNKTFMKYLEYIKNNMFYIDIKEFKKYDKSYKDISFSWSLEILEKYLME